MNYFQVAQTSRDQSSLQKWYRGAAEYLALPVQSWPQRIVLIVFGLFLALVVVGCTGNFSPFLSIAFVGGLIVAIVVIARPFFALLLVFLGAGFPSLFIPLPGHTMRPIEAALLLCLLVIVVRRPTMHFGLAHLLMLLFISIAIISFIHVPARSTGLDTYGADKRVFGELLILMAFFSGTFLVSYVKDVPAFLSMILLCNLPFCLIGLAQWIGVKLPTLLVPGGGIVEVSQEGRLSGPSDSPTTFAFYLVNLFTVALCCWLYGTRRRDRCIGACMTILTALEIIGSGTRGAAAAVVVAVIVALIVDRRFKLLLCIICSACIVVLTFAQQLLQKFTTHGADSDTNRLFLWNEAIKLIMANPWIGIGMEQFPRYYARLIVGLGDKLNPAGISIHNQYLDFALESGIPWLIVGLLLLLSIIVACWSAYRVAHRKYQGLLLATIIMVVANLVISFVDVPLEKAEASVVLFLLAGLAVGHVGIRKKARMD